MILRNYERSAWDKAARVFFMRRYDGRTWRLRNKGRRVRSARKSIYSPCKNFIPYLVCRCFSFSFSFSVTGERTRQCSHDHSRFPTLFSNHVYRFQPSAVAWDRTFLHPPNRDRSAGDSVSLDYKREDAVAAVVPFPISWRKRRRCFSRNRENNIQRGSVTGNEGDGISHRGFPRFEMRIDDGYVIRSSIPPALSFYTFIFVMHIHVHIFRAERSRRYYLGWTEDENKSPNDISASCLL